MYEDSWIEAYGLVFLGAVAVGLLCNRCKLPLIPGYLLIGVLISGFFESPRELLEQGQELIVLAEWGGLFLLFTIGLRFHVRQLRRILAPSLIAFGLQIIGFLFLGIQLAALFGWPMGDGLFLGLLMSLSSGMLSNSLLRSRGEEKHLEGQLVRGTLILESILGLVILLLWSSLRAQPIPGMEQVWLTVLVLVVLVICLFFAGRLVASRLIPAEESGGGSEWLLLAGLGMVMGIAWLAGSFEFAAPFGALLAGAVFSQVKRGEDLAGLMDPLRYFFGAVFFVVAGMQVSLEGLPGSLWLVFVLTVLTLFGKGLCCWCGYFLSGKPTWVSFQASVAKAQVGEFGIILAMLGLTAGLFSPQLYNLVLGTAFLSMILTPVLVGRGERLYSYVGSRVPRPVQLYGKIYHRLLYQASRRMDRNILWRLLRRPLLQILFYSVILAGVLLATAFFAFQAESYWEARPYPVIVHALIWLLGGLACLPFLISILRNLNVVVLLFLEANLRREAYRRLFAGKLGPALRLMLTMLVVVPMIGLFFAFAARSLPSGWGLSAFILTLLITGTVMWKRMIQLNSKMEYVFMESLNEETRSEHERRRHTLLEEISRKYPWPVKVTALSVPEAWGGRRLRDFPIREQSGAMVVGLGRGEHIVFDPGPGSPLFPGDRLYVFGQAREIEHAGKLLLNGPGAETASRDRTTLEIKTLYLNAESALIGNTLAGADLRRLHGINVLGIQRGDIRITAPSAEEILCEGDVLYVIGNQAAIEAFQ